MSITLEDRFEQYLLDEAWDAGLRRTEEVLAYVDYLRTTPRANRTLAIMRFQHALSNLPWSAANLKKRMSRDR